ncbi:MAG: OmpA family protein [Cyclobacteriaceae bacterium]
MSGLKSKLEMEKASLQESLQISEGKTKRLQNQVDQLVKDSLALYQALEKNKEELQQSEEKYKQLQYYYNELAENSGKLNQNLADKQQQLMELEVSMEMARKKNEELSASLEEREKKVLELETILAEKEKAVQDLKNLVSNALLNFAENDLSVEVRNGKVYVSLSEQLLFKSGSITIDPKGIAALQKLAQAIKDNEDINIMVEGHTDNVPISRISQYMKNNWDLSVMRATSIVKIITEAGIAPDRITAAGRGEFQPITSNDTAEGKNRNRRTEIILTPRLDELFKILQSN